MKEEPACRRAGVNAIRQALEVLAQPFQIGGKVDLLLDRAAKSIQFPDHKGITMAHVINCLPQAWAITSRAAQLVAKYLGAASSIERFQL